MASPAAQQMFQSLSPAEQQQVMASIAGNPNGLDDWYQNAAKAGDPRAFGAGGAGQSEDFRRFLDPGGEYNQQGQGAATLTGWAQQYYDEAASRAAGRPQFRSMRGEQGFFDKPTECPPGMGPSGPNESDPCTTKGYSEPAGGAPGQASTAPTGASGPSQSQMQMSMLYSPLRDLLANQGHFLRQFDSKIGDGQAGVRGGLMGGGGMWWSPTGQTQTGGAEPKPSSGLAVPTSSGQYGGINPGGMYSQPGGAQQGGAEVKSSVGSWSPANPYGGINPQPGPAQAGGGAKASTGSWTPANPYGGINPSANTGSLTSMLTPLQNQTAPSPLGSTLMPFQTQVRRKDPLANALGPAQQAGRWF